MSWLWFPACSLVRRAPAFADAIRVEHLFGVEFPDAYKHPVCLTELANGDLYLVYYGGSGEYGDDTWVRGSRLLRGSTQWTVPAVIADTPFRGDGNAVVWQAPDGLVWLFYVNRYGRTWSDSRIKYKISRRGEKLVGFGHAFVRARDDGSCAAHRAYERGLPFAGLP